MKEYSHYYKKVPYECVDVYRVLELFGVTDPAIQHAVKKLLVAGGRGHKDLEKDVKEAIVSLNRWIEMRKEDETFVSTVSSDIKTNIGPVGSMDYHYLDNCTVSNVRTTGPTEY
jgi:hypothetical protein